jgi:hypothetical protein
MADSCAKLRACETWNVIQDAAAGTFSQLDAMRAHRE